MSAILSVKLIGPTRSYTHYSSGAVKGRMCPDTEIAMLRGRDQDSTTPCAHGVLALYFLDSRAQTHTAHSPNWGRYVGEPALTQGLSGTRNVMKTSYQDQLSAKQQSLSPSRAPCRFRNTERPEPGPMHLKSV